MKFKQLFYFACIASVFINCKNSTIKNDSTSTLINIQLDSLLLTSGINAVSAGVIVDGKTYMFHKGELTKGKANTPNEETLYEIASLTKTFTGTLLANAIVDKKVRLDDDIRTRLSGDFQNLEFQNTPITFKNLATHRGRIPIMFPNKPAIFKNPDHNKLPYIINDLQKEYTKEDFFKELALIKVDTIPGTKFGYSNAGTNLLGYCIENIYNKDFEDIIREQILVPLKMNNTKITLTTKDKKNLAQGYTEKNVKMPFSADKDMNAAGGLKSTLSDMMKYTAYHLDENNPIIETSHQEILGLWDNFDNGLFWQIFTAKENQPRKIFQNGGAFGTSSWLTIVPEKKIGVFIVTNTAGPSVHNKLNKTVEVILKKLKK
jgi:CubicO group peptidase (beta-lactamase class C family)